MVPGLEVVELGKQSTPTHGDRIPPLDEVALSLLGMAFSAQKCGPPLPVLDHLLQHSAQGRASLIAYRRRKGTWFERCRALEHAPREPDVVLQHATDESSAGGLAETGHAQAGGRVIVDAVRRLDFVAPRAAAKRRRRCAKSLSKGARETPGRIVACVRADVGNGLAGSLQFPSGALQEDSAAKFAGRLARRLSHDAVEVEAAEVRPARQLLPAGGSVQALHEEVKIRAQRILRGSRRARPDPLLLETGLAPMRGSSSRAQCGAGSARCACLARSSSSDTARNLPSLR